ncbi:Na+/H+ antiporter subunit G [Bacillus niameyensis]|uniref:Na+/H+ antiporter subunit G n=1 Tax=Bacillus niameyensis TaxID=1522308 RepID=UPI000A600B5C|nr:Na+/H+ antiporter subunit G [Bacillus niameyensis]
MNESAEVVAGAFIFIGTLICLISSVGLVRLPDVYTRSHAASKSSTLGVLAILIGTQLYFLISEGYFSIRLILGIIFVFLTAPVAAHVICRAAYRANVPLTETSAEDELKDYFESNKQELSKTEMKNE